LRWPPIKKPPITRSTATNRLFSRRCIDAALLLALTLGGGLAWLHDFWARPLDGLSYGLAMIFSLMLISGLIDLPFRSTASSSSRPATASTG
jgi:hypothetical protein